MGNNDSSSMRKIRVGIREWLTSIGVQGLDDPQHENYVKLTARLDEYVAQKTENLREQVKLLTRTREEQNQMRKEKNIRYMEHQRVKKAAKE